MKTILVADDRESSRELTRTMLELSGYFVLEATNGAEALLLARETTPDLVLLDLQMPVKDGFDVLWDLRSERRFESLLIVALTASPIYGDKEHALKSGFAGYLTKPLSLFELRKELARLLPQNSEPLPDNAPVA